jgi:phosphotransferase system IIB component
MEQSTNIVSIANDTTKVTISLHGDSTVEEMLDAWVSAMVGVGYQMGSIENVIIDRAYELKKPKKK